MISRRARRFLGRILRPAGADWLSADSSRRSSRECARGASDGRAALLSGAPNRTQQAAVIVDGVVSHITVTDPRHALSGQRLSLVSLHSARGPAFVVAELGDGRRRSIRRSATDLGAAPSASLPPVSDLPWISARTLLPLAHHLTPTLASSAEEVIYDGPHPTVPASCCVSSVHFDSGEPAATLAQPAGRYASTDRPSSCRVAATHAGEQPHDRGEPAC
jgi:hypothetical protein